MVVEGLVRQISIFNCVVQCQWEADRSEQPPHLRQVDLDLPRSHPKRAFMYRVIELEVRLAYLDRIEQSLPERMLDEKGTGAAALQDTDPVLNIAEGES